MKTNYLCLAVIPFFGLNIFAATMQIGLGAADSFAVLAGSTTTNTGSTVVNSGPSQINGNVGIYPGNAVTGFPPGIVTGGTIHAGDAVAMQAQADLTIAYNMAAAQPCGMDLTSQDLGGKTLTPGTYCFASSAQLTGNLILDSLGDPNGVFLFEIGSTLTSASNSSVVLIDKAQGDSVFWQVSSSATLGTRTAFAGNILALTSVTLNTGATITCGRALARNGAVTLDTNVISIDTAGCETTVGGGNAPEPRTSVLMIAGLVLSLSAYCFRSVNGQSKT